MAQHTYEATVRLPNGREEKIRVEASDSSNAKAMLEHYGRVVGSVVRK